MLFAHIIRFIFSSLFLHLPEISPSRTTSSSDRQYLGLHGQTGGVRTAQCRRAVQNSQEKRQIVEDQKIGCWSSREEETTLIISCSTISESGSSYLCSYSKWSYCLIQSQCRILIHQSFYHLLISALLRTRCYVSTMRHLPIWKLDWTTCKVSLWWCRSISCPLEYVPIHFQDVPICSEDARSFSILNLIEFCIFWNCSSSFIFFRLPSILLGSLSSLEPVSSYSSTSF